MRFSIFGFSAILLTTAMPAMAQDQTAPASAITINGSATLTSDYKFRGISQTDGNFAVQGGFTIAHQSGFYVSVWGSSIDSYVTMHGSAHQELDLIAGYKKTIDGITLDGGALYYIYPGSRPGFPGDTSSSDFIEPYVSASYALGPVTAKVTANWAPKQRALSLVQGQATDPETGAYYTDPNLTRARSNFYLSGELSAAIPKTPLTATAHVGHNFETSWLTGGPYTDWSLGVSAVLLKNLTLGVSYVDTDTHFWSPTIEGKNLARGAVIGSVGVAF